MLRWLVFLLWPNIAERPESGDVGRTASPESPEPLGAVDDDLWWCTTEAGRLFGPEQEAGGLARIEEDTQTLAESKLHNG